MSWLQRLRDSYSVPKEVAPGYHEVDPTVKRAATEDEVDGWLAAADSRVPEVIPQLLALAEELGNERPFKWGQLHPQLRMLLKEADRRNVTWKRG